MPSPPHTIPITFAVIHNEELADVTLDFANNADVVSSTHWRVPRLEDEDMQARAFDAREFALLAAKRWRHYRDSDCVATSLAELRQMIASDPHGEFCFYLKVTADWFPASLGGAMVRRTWCNHLMIDFLFVHPSISGKAVNVKSIGVSLLQSICMIAQSLGCPLVWGEATRDSSAFYARQLERSILDRFDIHADEIKTFAALLEVEREKS